MHDGERPSVPQHPPHTSPDARTPARRRAGGKGSSSLSDDVWLSLNTPPAARALPRRAVGVAGGCGIFHPSCVALCVGPQNPSLIRNKPSRGVLARALRECARPVGVTLDARSLGTSCGPGWGAPARPRNLGGRLNWCAQPLLIARRRARAPDVGPPLEFVTSPPGGVSPPVLLHPGRVGAKCGPPDSSLRLKWPYRSIHPQTSPLSALL